MREPYEECPRFHKCSVNVCPLDPFVYKKNKLPEEEKCTLGKTIRLRIAEKHLDLLPHRGLTSREWIGRQKWESLSIDEKSKIQARLQENLSD